MSTSKPGKMQKLLDQLARARVGRNRQEQTLRNLQHMARGYEEQMKQSSRRPGRPSKTFDDFVLRAEFEDMRELHPGMSLTELRKAAARSLGLEFHVRADSTGVSPDRVAKSCRRVDRLLAAQRATAWDVAELLVLVRSVRNRMLAQAGGEPVNRHALERDLEDLLKILADLETQRDERRRGQASQAA